MLELFPDTDYHNAVNVYISPDLLAQLVDAGATPDEFIFISVGWIRLSATVDASLRGNRVRVPDAYWIDMQNMRRGKLEIEFFFKHRVIMRETVSLVNTV